jgi:hypothetical protein
MSPNNPTTIFPSIKSPMARPKMRHSPPRFEGEKALSICPGTDPPTMRGQVIENRHHTLCTELYSFPALGLLCVVYPLLEFLEHPTCEFDVVYVEVHCDASIFLGRVKGWSDKVMQEGPGDNDVESS